MTQSSSIPSAAVVQTGGPSHHKAFIAGVAALELQARAARCALPHFAVIERTRAAWLPALDVAADAGDLQQLVNLAADAPTEFAAGLASARAAGIQEG